MPEYVFFSEEKVQHKHELKIELPVDMGESNTRLTDRMAKTVAEKNAIDGLAYGEKVVAVFRGDEKIWPRVRQRKNTVPKDIDPDYEAMMADLGKVDPEDVATEDRLSSDTDE